MKLESLDFWNKSSSRKSSSFMNNHTWLHRGNWYKWYNYQLPAPESQHVTRAAFRNYLSQVGFISIFS